MGAASGGAVTLSAKACAARSGAPSAIGAKKVLAHRRSDGGHGDGLGSLAGGTYRLPPGPRLPGSARKEAPRGGTCAMQTSTDTKCALRSTKEIQKTPSLPMATASSPSSSRTSASASCGEWSDHAPPHSNSPQGLRTLRTSAPP